MGVGATLYFDAVKKTLSKIPEQRNQLPRENSYTPLGQFCLFDALNAAGDGLVFEMGGGLVSPLLEVEVIVVIRGAGLLVDRHGALQ
jgi:hypothetical protein